MKIIFIILNEYLYQAYDIECLMDYDLMNLQKEPSLYLVKTNQIISL